MEPLLGAQRATLSANGSFRNELGTKHFVTGHRTLRTCYSGSSVFGIWMIQNFRGYAHKKNSLAPQTICTLANLSFRKLSKITLPTKDSIYRPRGWVCEPRYHWVNLSWNGNRTWSMRDSFADNKTKWGGWEVFKPNDIITTRNWKAIGNKAALA